MDLNLIPVRDSGCVEEMLEGEIVLYGSGAAKAFYLNESAALVWLLIDGQRRLADIALLLSEAYPEAENLGQDLQGIVEAMRQHGVVHLP